jgi:ABC-type uncharacterized transport system ATPase subunit
MFVSKHNLSRAKYICCNKLILNNMSEVYNNIYKMLKQICQNEIMLDKMSKNNSELNKLELICQNGIISGDNYNYKLDNVCETKLQTDPYLAKFESHTMSDTDH